MSRKLRFGVLILQNLPYPTLVDWWQQVEVLGFDTLWVADHFVEPRRPKDIWFDGWTLLAAMSTHTTSIRIGTLVASITLRNPAVLAKEAMTIDHISGGRLELGIGAGRTPLDHSMTGTDIWESSERTRRFSEFVEIVDGMLRNEVSTYQGDYYNVQEAVMSPGSVQKPRPPLTLAAHGPSTLKVTASYADSWNSFGGFGVSAEESLAITWQRNQMLNEFCDQIGRNLDTIRRSFLAGFTGDTPFASIGAFQDFVGRYQEAGINEFIFYWMTPKCAEQFPQASRITSRETLTQFATKAIPTMRTSE